MAEITIEDVKSGLSALATFVVTPCGPSNFGCGQAAIRNLLISTRILHSSTATAIKRRFCEKFGGTLYVTKDGERYSKKIIYPQIYQKILDRMRSPVLIIGTGVPNLYNYKTFGFFEWLEKEKNWTLLRSNAIRNPNSLSSIEGWVASYPQGYHERLL